MFDTEEEFAQNIIERVSQYDDRSILEIHKDENSAAEAVVMSTDTFERILSLIPDGEEITNIVMNHHHVNAG